MSNDIEDRIKNLSNQINSLEKQKQILLDFVVFIPDIANSVIDSIASTNPKEAVEKLQDLQLSVFEMLKEIGPLEKLP